MGSSSTVTLPVSRRARAALPRRAVGRWLLIVGAAVVVFSTGFVLMEGWTPLDALYMTVITMTTVGFREVHELDAVGRAWTMLVAIGGAAVIFGSIGILAETLLVESASGKREARRMRNAVDRLSGHYIVCGYGRVGSTAVRELEHAGQQICVIDVRPESLERAKADGHVIVEGDATADATLLAAGVERARGLVATVDSDALNVYVTLSARALNPNLYIVGRASEPGADTKLHQAGADRVVSPYTRAGRQIAELAVRPRVADYIDLALSHGERAFSLEEVEVAAGSGLEGRTVEELRGAGVVTLAISRGPKAYEPNPAPERRFVAGESLVVSGSAEAVRSLREWADPVRSSKVPARG